MSVSVEDSADRCDYAEVFVDLVEHAFLDRKKAQEKTLTNQEPIEVCSVLLARQVTLAKYLAYTPNFWTIHVAPLIFRCMSDININLAWISQDPQPRSKLFVDYGLRQAKQSLNHRRSLTANEPLDARAVEHIDALEAWISRQRDEQQLTDENRGNWSGKNAREMARESGCEELYDFEYVTMTRLLHIDWMSSLTLYPVSIGSYDPKSSYDSYPSLREMTLPHELYLATKMIIQTFNSFDKMTGFSSTDVLRLKQFRDHLKHIDASAISESFSTRFTVYPKSGIEGKALQDHLTRSLAVFSEHILSSIGSRIASIREVFCEPTITAVLVPLLGRLASLMEYSVGVPHAWNAYIAPIVLRSLAEIMLSIMWISGDIVQRTRQFIHASVVQGRNDLERFEESIRKRSFSSDAGMMRDFMKSRIESHEQLLSWNTNQDRVPHLRIMAKNADCMNFYNIEISEWSACVHSSWHHVGLHNLKYCDDPLYSLHRVPMVAPLECDIRYLRSAATIGQSCVEEIDKMLRIDEAQTGSSLLEIFDSELAHIQTMQSDHQSDPAGKLDRSDQSLYIYPVRREDHHISEQLGRLHADALQGDSETRFMLGQAHWNGVLPASDPSEAIRLFVQAAEQGHTHAQYLLACIHTQGPTEYRDFFKALVWLIRLMAVAEVNPALEDRIVALRMAVSSELSVEQLTRARDDALGGAV